MIPNIRDFLSWFLPYCKKDGIPKTAVFPIPYEEVGTQIAHYLLGTIWTRCTRENIKAAWAQHYSTQYSWDEFDELTKDWLATERSTDCQGANDAFFRYIWEGGDGVTDTSADGCYRNWCGEKGKITDRKALPLGAAVFKDADGKKTHIGYICGFDGDEPLVMEAQSFKYGCRVNYLKNRTVFTYYGIMDKKYDYADPEPDYPAEPLPLDVTKPVHNGEAYRAMQMALNLLGYTDGDGCLLVEDGKWGKRSRQAYDKCVAANLGTISFDGTLHIEGVCDKQMTLKEE